MSALVESAVNVDLTIHTSAKDIIDGLEGGPAVLEFIWQLVCLCESHATRLYLQERLNYRLAAEPVDHWEIEA